jgi:hypothetical protein
MEGEIMDVREVLKLVLSTSKQWADKQLEDISEEDSMVSGKDGLSHIRWQAGHLCHGARMIAAALGNAPEFDDGERYKALFDWQTSPSSDAGSYPSLEEIKNHYSTFHQAGLDAIDKLSDADIDKEIQVTDEWKEKTGNFVIGFAQHQAYHVGQIANVRAKVLDRKGLFG